MTSKFLDNKAKPIQLLFNILIIIVVVFAFLLSLKMMGGAFKLFGEDLAKEIIEATSNPFVSLFIGLLATAIIQSSSTTTTMVVTMVATGSLTIEHAVPMIMGANIGTSVTSSIVSLGHIGNKKEYKKAVSAATVHDFFNIMVVLVLFPLEYFFGFLSNLSKTLTNFLIINAPESDKEFSIMELVITPVYDFIMNILMGNALIILLFSLLMLFISLRYLTIILKKMLIGKAEKKIDKLIFNKPVKALGWGMLLTVAVQSSSVTTSLIVPMVASSKVSLRKAFPFLIGANIGTTVTALIAALSTNNHEFFAALTIAFTHILFNILGAVLLFPIRPIREIPVKLSRKLGNATMKNRLAGMAYIVITFFLIPFLLILVSSEKVKIKEYKFKTTNLISGEVNFFTCIDEKYKNSSSIKRKFFDGTSNLQDYKDLEPTDSIRIIKKDSVIHIGNNKYCISDIGFCFSDDNEQKTKLCIENIISNYRINENIIINKCVVFSKYYQINKNLNIEKLYLDIDNLIVFKKEILNNAGELIFTMELEHNEL